MKTYLEASAFQVKVEDVLDFCCLFIDFTCFRACAVRTQGARKAHEMRIQGA
jgi:hypothetical protein